MTSPTETRRPHPVPAASWLISALDRHGLREQVDARTATGIEVVARFTIAQYICHCGGPDELSHIVGNDCPPHPLHPGN